MHKLSAFFLEFIASRGGACTSRKNFSSAVSLQETDGTRGTWVDLNARVLRQMNLLPSFIAAAPPDGLCVCVCRGGVTQGFQPNTPLRLLPRKQTHRRGSSVGTMMMKYLRRCHMKVRLDAFQVIQGYLTAFSTSSHNSTANWHQLLALVFKTRLTVALRNEMIKSQLTQRRLRGRC